MQTFVNRAIKSSREITVKIVGHKNIAIESATERTTKIIHRPTNTLNTQNVFEELRCLGQLGGNRHRQLT